MNEFVVVGGGLHGTYLTNRLLDSYDPEDVTVVDPEPRLLAVFERRAVACGMSELRSPFVHHLGRDPFDLETFAEGRDRTGELVPTPGYPPRPTLELFLDHARHVIDRRNLSDRHRQGRVTGIDSAGCGLRVETTDGDLRTQNVVLAVGTGPPKLPSWACEGVDHVWSVPESATTSPETAANAAVASDGGRTNPVDEPSVVVGGGITAAQTALSCEADTLLTRHPLRTAVTEADTPWINWGRIEKRLHKHPPGSRARLETVEAARNDGSLLPGLRKDLEASAVGVEVGEVVSAVPDGGGVLLRLDDGRTLEATGVRCATGFEPAWSQPIVQRLAEQLGLERGHDGVPVLDDDTLQWRGETDGVYVTGALAAATVGPFAGNVIGARRSAERIIG